MENSEIYSWFDNLSYIESLDVFEELYPQDKDYTTLVIRGVE